jgi:hypothetical protein
MSPTFAKHSDSTTAQQLATVSFTELKAAHSNFRQVATVTDALCSFAPFVVSLVAIESHSATELTELSLVCLVLFGLSHFGLGSAAG